MTDEYTHFIKWRKEGERAWWFLTPSGGGNRKRIYASRFGASFVDRVLDELRKGNPGHEFKKQRI